MSIYQNINGEVDAFFTHSFSNACGKPVYKFVDKINLNLIYLLFVSQLKVVNLLAPEIIVDEIIWYNYKK